MYHDHNTDIRLTAHHYQKQVDHNYIRIVLLRMLGQSKTAVYILVLLDICTRLCVHHIHIFLHFGRGLLLNNFRGHIDNFSQKTQKDIHIYNVL